MEMGLFFIDTVKKGVIEFVNNYDSIERKEVSTLKERIPSFIDGEIREGG